MSYKIGEVANLAGVSVRTLHHYHQLGLLVPDKTNAKGYRLYSDEELSRLQQILFFKELGFSLGEIKEILDNPQFDRKEALIAQKELMLERKRRLEAILSLVEESIKSIEGGFEMSKKDMFGAFDMSAIEEHQRKYAEETRQKYGHTQAYQESQKRTSRYTAEDWQRITEQQTAIYQRLAGLMDKGPADPDVQEAVANWRTLISENFYECTLEILRGLGDLYVSDQRFTDNIDKYRPGLARFMQQAMHIYCDRHEGS